MTRKASGLLGTGLLLLSVNTCTPLGACLLNCEQATESIDAPQAQTITGGNLSQTTSNSAPDLPL